ncbi:hypothetical protein L2E82_17855 [Cichorium intybus]|uniref:Uncharacterized protein n=1 Tax=Cichorium intybus TaxID=13427 RepID=A0ACB9F8H3_CICIN|nr:hypothetical protein L2E82_17855 [Cichorium intybus]
MKIGELVDVFVCKRRDKRGYRFGFVRFNQVKNVREVEETLKKTSLGGRRLFARVARFEREKGRDKSKVNGNNQEMKGRNRFDGGSSLRSPDVSFVDAVKGFVAPSKKAQSMGDWVCFDTRNKEEEVKIRESKELSACFRNLVHWDESLEIKKQIRVTEEKIFNSQQFSSDFKNTEEGDGEFSSDEEEDMMLDSDDDLSEEYSGEEEERSFEESACRETNFEVDSNVGQHVQIREDEETVLCENSKDGEEFIPGYLENPLESGGQVGEQKIASPINELNGTYLISSPTHSVGQEHATDQSQIEKNNPVDLIEGNKSPILESLKYSEDRLRNLQKNKYITIERRVTRSQSRQKETKSISNSCSSSNRRYANLMGREDSEMSVGVSNRLEEIRGRCGLRKSFASKGSRRLAVRNGVSSGNQ